MKERGTTFLLLTLVCLADMAFAFDAASSFIITGSTTQIAGTGNDLTLTATDSSGFPDTEYNGVKTLFFSAAPAPPDSPQRPTVSDDDGNRQEFGTATVILFNNGVATVNGGDRNGRMFLYRSGTFTISATDGIIGSSGFVGTVQPHVESTLVIINGALPVFVKIKSREPFSDLVTFP